MSVPLSWYLILAAALFSIGLFGVLSRKNAIAILLGVELMLNAVNINLVAFWRYLDPCTNGWTGFCSHCICCGGCRSGCRSCADYLGLSPAEDGGGR